MFEVFFTEKTCPAIPLFVLSAEEFQSWLSEQVESWQEWVRHCGFKPKPGKIFLMPDAMGSLATAIVIGDRSDRWALGDACRTLPAHDYQLQGLDCEDQWGCLALGWGLGAYQFTQYLPVSDEPLPRLGLPANAALNKAIRDDITAITLVRDLINTPAEDMMPEHLASAMQAMVIDFACEFKQIIGEELIQKNYPALFAVGKGSVHEPRLLDLSWGNPEHPLVTLVGKGVCFDTGGLDLKPSKYMRNMKKDMGGAAHALGLAHMIMAAQLPLRLRVLIGAAENVVSGNVFRPGDILRTRLGKTVEVDNTDAEGRLAICDALTEAGAEKPELILDFATLTGAARVALGTEIPVFFTNQQDVALGLNHAAENSRELIWQLPLHAEYKEELKSEIADLINCGAGYGGAITAALFLNEFVPEEIDWVHFDLMAWNNRKRPGRPKGGEAMGLFAVFEYLKQRFG